MDGKDAAILRVVSGLWETYEWVPISQIIKRVPWNALKVRAKIRELEKAGMLSWNGSIMGEPSVRITEKGLDSLVFRDLLLNGVVDRIGGVIGSGKEADVLLAFRGEKKVAIKLHRYYSAEFKKIKRSLAYSMLSWWRKKLRRKARPVDVARAKAQVEYYVLKRLDGKVSVPHPITINRHAVVMEFLGEDMPAPTMAELRDAEMKECAKEEYEKALSMGVVHGDFSPFNVVVWETCYIIDWPQAVPRDFPGAEKLIERDRKWIS